MPTDTIKQIFESISNQKSGTIEGVIPCRKLTTTQAIGVYQTAYRVRMTEALGETFEVVWWCLGDEPFFDICREFILANPSTSYNLADYGVKFPDFLEVKAVSKEMPFLKNLAEFEWQFKEIFHGPEEKSLAQEFWSQLAEFEKPKIKFTAQMKLFSYPYGIRNIWRSFKNSQDQNLFEKPEWQDSQDFLLYKNNHEVFLKDLGSSEYTFLTRLSQGLAIDDAATGMALDEKGITDLFEFLFSHNLVANISCQCSASCLDVDAIKT